jgi:C-terminal processing protease CtpA/Prc
LNDGTTLISALDDPYSRFVDPTDFAPLLKYDISGVGVNVAEDAEDPTKIRVLGLVLDSSAARAGIERRGKSAFQARHTGPHTTAFAL